MRTFNRCEAKDPDARWCMRKRNHRGPHYSGGVRWESNPRISQNQNDDVLEQVVVKADSAMLLDWLQYGKTPGGAQLHPDFIQSVRTELERRIQHGAPLNA